MRIDGFAFPRGVGLLFECRSSADIRARDALTRIELQTELMRIWEKDRKTVLMVTHDVDEALYLADRVVMMTAGPAAGIGKIQKVGLPTGDVRTGRK